MSKKRVLWIEDGALTDLPQLVGPVYVDGNIALTVALDASDGFRKLRTEEYHAVIVDIRLPPGNDDVWIRLFEAVKQDKTQARLGLVLLDACLGTPVPELRTEPRPEWWSESGRFAVFSVEHQRELASDLRRLNLTLYRQKSARESRLVLLELIRSILDNHATVPTNAESPD